MGPIITLNYWSYSHQILYTCIGRIKLVVLGDNSIGYWRVWLCWCRSARVGDICVAMQRSTNGMTDVNVWTIKWFIQRLHNNWHQRWRTSPPQSFGKSASPPLTQRIPIGYNGSPKFTSKTTLPLRRSPPHLIYQSSTYTPLTTANGIRIQSAILPQYTFGTDTHIDRRNRRQTTKSAYPHALWIAYLHKQFSIAC